jgi:hypothetical protein
VATPVPTTIAMHGTPPPGWIAIEKVSNGCGGGDASTEPGIQNMVGDSATYGTGNPFEPSFKVNFREACNFHDAAYSGALVWDSLKGKFTDFRGITQKEADDKMQADMDLLCEAQIPERWPKARANCKSGINHWLLVSAIGSVNFRDRTEIDGMWHNVAPGWPLCDIGANDWTITQNGRNVTVRWRNGAGGSQVGTFKGVLVTGDKPRDDRVVGEYTINDHGAKVSGGTMTFALSGDKDRFDFNGTGVPGGTMARNERSTQSASAPPRCSKPASTPTTTTTPAVPKGTFVLASAKLTDNPYGKEVTVGASGGTATWDHCCDGGKWKIQYTWKFPASITPGKSSSISMSLKTVSVEPSQPLSDQMTALAPDFRQDLTTNYPNPASASKTYTVPLSVGYNDPNYKEIKLYVGFAHATVTFTYRRVSG